MSLLLDKKEEEKAQANETYQVFELWHESFVSTLDSFDLSSSRDDTPQSPCSRSGWRPGFDTSFERLAFGFGDGGDRKVALGRREVGKVEILTFGTADVRKEEGKTIVQLPLKLRGYRNVCVEIRKGDQTKELT